ncbi:MAG TPA: dihydrodipicolinate synthase family protein [Gemmatimonadaceae bacterium]|nr:dihydrodipicolinate synthase family protein [Gemmatimonadaceae bacterium]
MKGQLRGVLAPVVTPFARANQSINAAAFRDNVAAHLGAGLSGVVVAGSTGEAALLDEDERAMLVEAARDLVPDDRWLLAGVGGESTRHTVRRAREAGKRGADAVLVVAPHYYGAAAMTEAALLVHYRRVADECPVPVVLYNIPKYMHFSLPPAVVAQLSKHPNITGMKDSSGDAALNAAYLTLQSERFSVLTGHGGTFADALERGARGGILAVALFAPRLCLAVIDSYLAGDAEGARRAQARLTPLALEIVGKMQISGIKAALDLVGLTGGDPRHPLLPLTPNEVARVGELLRAAELALAA